MLQSLTTANPRAKAGTCFEIMSDFRQNHDFERILAEDEKLHTRTQAKMNILALKYHWDWDWL